MAVGLPGADLAEFFVNAACASGGAACACRLRRDRPADRAQGLPAALRGHPRQPEPGRDHHGHLLRGPHAADIGRGPHPHPQYRQDLGRQDLRFRAIAPPPIPRRRRAEAGCSAREAPLPTAARSRSALPPRRSSAPPPGARSPDNAAPASHPCSPATVPATRQRPDDPKPAPSPRTLR